VSAADTPRTDASLRAFAAAGRHVALDYVESMTRVGALLWIGSALAYFVAEAFAAAALPAYGYATDYISLLGDPTRSPHASLLNAALLAQAVLFPAGAVLVSGGIGGRKVVLFRTFAVLNGIGNLLVASVHSGSSSLWHPVGAALAIGCGNAAVVVGAAVLSPTTSRTYRVVSVALGVLGLLCLIPVALTTTPVGLWERASVYPIFGWQVYAAVCLSFRRSSAR
jgi:hypothetical protein